MIRFVLIPTLVLLACSILARAAVPDDRLAELVIAEENAVEIVGKIHEKMDVSAIKMRGDLMLLVSDEGGTVEILKRLSGGTAGGVAGRGFDADAAENLQLPLRDERQELDLEGLAWSNKFVFAVGSHSCKRKRVVFFGEKKKDQKKKKKNLKRLGTVSNEPGPNRLFRFEIDPDGKIEPGSLISTSLSDLIGNHPLLQRFQNIPSKENGIDIEGIAADGDETLYVGLRGPVLRGGYVPVPVISLTPDKSESKLRPKLKEMKFVHLDGLGIRDIARPRGGSDFFILAGPVGDGPGGYRLYRWDGEDCVPGKDKPKARAHVQFLCGIPPPRRFSDSEKAQVKAEGLAIVNPSLEALEIVVVYDGAPNGMPTRFTFKRRAH